MSSDIFVIHVPKSKLWVKIDDILMEKGYSWDGASARKYWNIFGKESCICIDHDTKKLMFARKEYYKNQDKTMFTAKDFLAMYNNTHGMFGALRLFTLGMVLRLRRKEVRW